MLYIQIPVILILFYLILFILYFTQHGPDQNSTKSSFTFKKCTLNTFKVYIKLKNNYTFQYTCNTLKQHNERRGMRDFCRRQ